LPYRPDVIACGNGVLFYADIISTTELSYYKRFDENKNVYHVNFKGDTNGTFDSRDDHSSSLDCQGKSIKDLYNEGKAFNLVSSKPKSISGQNNQYKTNDWPYAIDCSHYANKKYILWMQSTNQDTTHNVQYYRVHDTYQKFTFKADGTYDSQSNMVVTGCDGKT